MRLCFLDFETFFDRKTKHSLTSMNPVEYVMHPDTEIQVLTYAFDREPVQATIGEHKIAEFFDCQRWDDTLIVSHNGNLFDHMITAWRFGVKPMMWGDTLAMAKPIFGTTVGGSLDKLATALKLGKKGSLEATKTEGTYVREWTWEMHQSIAAYAKQDTVLLRKLFAKLLPLTPEHELRLIDLTARMVVEPGFAVDMDMLTSALAGERKRKRVAVKRLAEKLDEDDTEVVKKMLQSNPQFAQFLRSEGVDPPVKVSTTTGKETFAFAKTDQGMLALQQHENPIVAAAADIRLETKSSILESRLETFLTMAHHHPEHKMPIGLNYWGASTGRWSGALSANQQNLPRVNPKKPSPMDALRNCLIAPKGHTVVVADLSGIELRVSLFLWKVQYAMDLYAEDAQADLYKAFASRFYEVPTDQVTKDQRQFSKMMMLGLGYGMSANKFRVTAKLQGTDLTQNQAEEAVNKWREVHSDIVDGWRQCGDALPSIQTGSDFVIDPWGLCSTSDEAPYIVKTPGSCLRYSNLRREKDEQTGKYNWVYGEGRNKRRIYSSLLDENIVQHLSRNILAEQALKIAEEYPVVHLVHDEIVSVVPDNQAQDCLHFMLDTMRTPPAWWPEIVLYAEGDTAKSYGAAK